MIYQLSKDFTKITETTGTVQNTSQIYTLEMSQSNVKDSGIFIYPLQSKSFANKVIYLRCADGAGADARVVPFEVGAEGSISAAISSAPDNLLSLKADGLFVGDDTTDDITGFQNALRQSFGFSS